MKSGSDLLKGWREEHYHDVLNKVLYKRDPMQETFKDFGTAKDLIN